MNKIILTMALAVSVFSFAQDKTGEVKKDSISEGKIKEQSLGTEVSLNANLDFPVLFSVIRRDKQAKVKQEKRLTTIYASANLGFYGISRETQDKKSKAMSCISNFNYGTMVVSHGGVDYRGNGYSIESGVRSYFGKNAKINEDFYIEGLTSYTRITFTDSNYHGTYNYFTPLNMSLGYKFRLGEHLVIDPSVGVVWKLEIMPNGNLDNKDFSNWLPKAGVKVGYRF